MEAQIEFYPLIERELPGTPDIEQVGVMRVLGESPGWDVARCLVVEEWDDEAGATVTHREMSPRGEVLPCSAAIVGARDLARDLGFEVG